MLVRDALDHAATLHADTEANRATHRRAVTAYVRVDEHFDSDRAYPRDKPAAWRIYGKCAQGHARETVMPSVAQVTRRSDAITNLDATMEALVGPRDGSQGATEGRRAP